MHIKILATTGRAAGQAVEIRAAKFFIGRHENCQIRPDIRDLANIHALIEQRGDHIYLRDFGAEGGTGVNDRVLHAREIEVFDGDLIQVGPMVLTLAVRPRGDDSNPGLMHAPDGWPFLEEDAAGPDPSPRPSRAEAPTPSARPSPPSPAPRPRVDPSPAPAYRPEPAPLGVSAPAASAVVAARPVALPLSTKPIVTRPHGQQALDTRMVGDVMVVTILSPELQEEGTVSPVRYELRSILDEETVPTRTVIDLGNTKFLSSRAVGVLLAHYQGLDRKGAAMRVCRVSKEIKPVLDQMRLSMLIDIFPTVDEAVETPWE